MNLLATKFPLLAGDVAVFVIYIQSNGGGGNSDSNTNTNNKYTDSVIDNKDYIIFYIRLLLVLTILYNHGMFNNIIYFKTLDIYLVL